MKRSSPSAPASDPALVTALALAQGLYPHQVEGVAFLLGRRRAILADDMGLGKTRQAVLALTHTAPAGPYLVVCPASVKHNWAREIALAAGEAETHLVGPAAPPAPGFTGWVVVNYDLLAKHLEALLAHRFAGVVFDEAHYLKNHTSQRSRLGTRVVEAAGPEAPVYALTGTPLTSRPRDLYPLLKLIGHPLGRSFLSFAKRYCAAHHNGFGWVTDGASHLEELTVELHGALLRREKSAVLSLPPKTRTWLEVEVPEGTAVRETRAALLELVRGRARERLGEPVSASAAPGGARGQLLAKLTRARQQLALAKVKSTVDLVEGALAQGEKVLVFSGFEEPLARLHAHFGERSVLLTGKTPSAARQGLVDRFQHEPGVQVFCANLIAGGVGLNLTAARQVVFNDLDWVPANHWQAEDRAYRIGQSGTVTVHYLVAAGTLDAFVQAVLEAKSALVAAVVDGAALAADPRADVLGELEGVLSALSPRLAELPEGELSAGVLEGLLREAADTWRAGQGEAGAGAAAPVPALPESALRLLAEVLRGQKAQRYRVASGSRPGLFYTLEVSEGDVLCSCPGFEYRGTCSHARALKGALTAGRALPPGYAAVEAA